ncbi:MAG TPA: nucleotidyltransferase domain-containing protein [Candidatus Dormibacteraeota bacterium]
MPPLDAAALGRLSNALDREGVVAAMLIGSQARGNPGPLSDVDIGIWHDPGLDAHGRFDLQLDLAGEITSLLETDEVDLVLLNNAPPLIRHRAIREGKRLVERDHDERVRLETRAILDYLDTAPLRVELGRGVRRRMKEGRFGRRQSG